MLIFEKFIFVLKAQNTLFIPQAIGTWNQAIVKPNMCYTNYHHTNHNVKTCKNKKEEEPIIDVTKSIIHASKPPKQLNYPFTLVEYWVTN